MGGWGGLWGVGLGVRVDVNEELKFLCKFKKKKFGGGGQGGGGGWGVGGGVRVDVNEVFLGGGGVGGSVGGRVGGGVRVDVNDELKFL